ncbi:uncharacterized protein LOC130709495 [Lotus japonicus]|uniref:uncharacterized protein LOC130709495 n=1 Tax=Lotus japonicus TaxID=34305 RepID=UPI002589E690|nr:uncharacterized protein LOC130709495 [Lotus japonicus]
MYSDFKTQAIEYVKQAVQEDNARNYAKAFPLYMNALEYFKIHLKYETNPKIKEAITQKFTEYLNRAEEIRAILDYKGGSGPTSSNWDVAVATQPKTKPPEGEGGDGEDPEHAKLKEKQNNDVVGLESAKQEAMILPITGVELQFGKMYTTFFKDQAIEYVKQAVHEDNAGNYAKAFPLYMNALEYFKTHLKYETNPKIKEAIIQKFTEYLGRAKEIQVVLDDIGPDPTSNKDDTMAMQPNEGEGGVREDLEQAKLSEKRNDVGELESVKQEVVISPFTAYDRNEDGGPI